MAGEEPDELVEVTVVDEEAPAPEKSVLSGAETESALPLPEGEGRHRVVTPGYLQQDTDTFNSALKILFVFCLGVALLVVVLLDIKTSRGPGVRSWLSGVFTFDVFIDISLLAALFGLGVYIKKHGLIPDLSQNGWSNWQHGLNNKLNHYVHKLLPVCKAAARSAVDWLQN